MSAYAGQMSCFRDASSPAAHYLQTDALPPKTGRCSIGALQKIRYIRITSLFIIIVVVLLLIIIIIIIPVHVATKWSNLKSIYPNLTILYRAEFPRWPFSLACLAARPHIWWRPCGEIWLHQQEIMLTWSAATCLQTDILWHSKPMRHGCFH